MAHTNGKPMSNKPYWVETIPLREHLEAMRASDRELMEERDRRYAEVNVEREKALKIKETADLAALQLARESQTLKDENTEKMRNQIESDRASSPERYRGDFEKLAENIERVAKNSADAISQVLKHVETQMQPMRAFISKFEGMESSGQQVAQESRALANFRLAAVGLAVTVVLGVLAFVLKG